MVNEKGKKKGIQVSSAHNIISSFYLNCFSLLTYIRQVRKDEIITADDPPEYRQFLKSTLVAIPRNQSATPPFHPSHTQWFTLKEIINKVIEHCCRANKSNVLGFGFETLSSNEKIGHGPVAGTFGIQNSYPNTIVSYLRTSKEWQRLHERLGDDLMVHLLQNLALFVKGDSKCHFQVAGYPICRLTSLSKKGVPEKPRVPKEKKSIQPATKGSRSTGKRKIQRGGKRVKRAHKNLPNQENKQSSSFAGVIDTRTGSGPQSVQKYDSLNLECDKVDTTLNFTDLDQAECCKRKAIEKVNDPQGEPRLKKSRVTLNDVEASPCLFPEETDESAAKSSAGRCSLYSLSDQDEGNKIQTETEGNVGEESPLLFPEGELSLSCDLLSDTSSFDIINDAPMESMQENSPLIPLKECSNVTSSVVEKDQDKIGMTASLSQNKNNLKRRLFSDADDKEKGSRKKCKKRKPWQVLLRFLPQSSKKKCLPKEGPDQTQKGGSQKPKVQRIKNHKSKVQPISKQRSQGIHLHEIYLPHSRLFYASNLSQSFPKKHIMETTPVSISGARRLIHHIFVKGQCLVGDCEKGGIRKESSNQNVTGPTSSQKQSECKKGKPFRLPKRLKGMQTIFAKFLARHKKCPFRTLLRCHCFYTPEGRKPKREARYRKFMKSGKKKKAVATILSNLSTGRVWQKHSSKKGCPKVFKSFHKKQTNVDSSVYQHAVSVYTKQSKVVRFLECVCHKVVPKDLWGCPQNKRIFLRNLAKFVKLRKGEKFSLGQMMTGIKISSCKWLKMKEQEDKNVPLTDYLKRQQLLAQFVWWLVTHYLIPLLKGFFYITESGTHRQRVFYYRKPVWVKIQKFGVNTFCGEFFKPLSTKEAENLLQRKLSLGFSPLRFIPKNSTVRPITNMKHCPPTVEPVNAQKQKPINRKLQNLFEVLKFEKGRNPDSLRTTLFGSDDLYQVLKPFAERVRKSSDLRPLYFVHVDVRHCYESIPHQKLFDIMKEVLEEEEYLIRRFWLLKMSAGKVHREFRKHTSTADDCCSFPDFFRSLVAAWRLKHVIAVDLVWYLIEEKEKLVELLREHIFNNVVRIGNKYYQQIRGIAQGSILSTLLCGYFYSDMEKTQLTEITQDSDSLLLRWVDDFLLITPQSALAVKFLDVMNAGIPEYGCCINPDKTMVNFDAATADGKQVKRISQGDRFPWCGYLLDTVTLEVRSDLSRYQGVQLRDTLSVALEAHPGQALRRKLLFSIRPKCHPLLLDQDLNSRESILFNVFQLFLLTAKKFHTYTKELPRGRQPKDNPSFFCKLLLDLAQYFHATSSRKCRQLSSSKASFSLNENEVTWLCLHAFYTCLRKMKARYGELLQFLTSGLKRIGNPAEDLKKATDPSIHSLIKKIR
ncbi:telomerase reverse transcriptase-like [Montipora foliosa]|uniref:telomerase reverse transcriptase-like n=1 Tax=Montipora foliosa TaxID=591990 RepID=UPI0035F1BEC4